jgi:threonine dehydratase
MSHPRERLAHASRASDLPETVAERDVLAARRGVEAVARRTPVLSTRTISERVGGEVVLKAENLQRTGSFKVRGVAAKLEALGAAGCAAGVVTASAGNHAQAVAAAARARGVPAEVYVPTDAPLSKVEAARELGATVHIGGGSVDECLGAARERAGEGGLAFVHPFDDPAVVAGQGSLGLELLEDVPDLAKIVVPVGGGGLCAGIAVAVKAARPEVEVVGVQVAACAPYPESLRAGEPVEASSALTIADGIAVKRPGGVPLALLSRLADDVVVVDEDETAEAMVLLMERCKLVVEGAGAVGVAALLGGQVRPAARGTTVAVLSGGNVDAGLLAAIARRHETEAGRRLVLLTRVPDRPGNLASLLVRVAGTGANIVDVAHVREGLDLHVRETAIELVLETRGQAHADAVLADLRAAGYAAQVLR